MFIILLEWNDYMFPEDAGGRFRGGEAGAGEVEVAAGLHKQLPVTLDRRLNNTIR